LLLAPDRAAPDDPVSPDAARFRLFDALARFLARVSRHVPLVVVLDDLQWSDEPSLLALRLLAEQLRTARVLLLGTYRDAEAGPLLRELARGARVVPLSGLDEPAIAELIERVAGRPSDPAVAHQVWLRTGGNPFFAREVTRLLGTAQGVPEGVRDILAQRLARLSRDCADLLGLAALAGREFAVDLLARATGEPADRLVDLLEEAAGQRVLLRPPAPPGRYRFVHDLFRETIAEGLRSADQARRHLALARALTGLREEGHPVPAARLAAHLSQAGPAAAGEAVRYASLAAAEAAAHLAYEDACQYLERALDAADLAGDVPPARRPRPRRLPARRRPGTHARRAGRAGAGRARPAPARRPLRQPRPGHRHPPGGGRRRADDG
jgi:predicted ATPase